MKLNALQSELEQIYDVTTPHRVEDFLLQEPRLVAHLTEDASAHECPEKLLVAQTEDGLDVGLFLHETVLGRLAEDNPAESLHEGNLQDYCFVVEGVSHFLYLAWNAGFERYITQLELELVAEVDKFVSTAARLLEHVARWSPALCSGLCLNVSLFVLNCRRSNASVTTRPIAWHPGIAGAWLTSMH